MEILLDPTVWIGLLTLTALEIVLGIDNLIFISILTAGLAREEARKAQRIGLLLALAMRVVLLFFIAWIISLRQPIFTLFDHGYSWRDLILIAGGIFLLFKATHEIHNEIEVPEAERTPHAERGATITWVIVQIALINLVFSIDSIVTAIGLSDRVPVMMVAIIVSMVVMYFAMEPLSKFMHEHPSTKVLALAFLILVGATLVADGVGFHVPHGYIYFAMAFSAAIEMINVWIRTNRKKAGVAAH